MEFAMVDYRKRTQAYCAACGKEFQSVISEIKRGKGKFCSLSCAASQSAKNRDQSGNKNPKWCGGLSNSERKKRYRERHPERHLAHYELTKAIRDGVLTPVPCEICGNPKVEGHHEDYSRPLDVIWLCKTHHLEAHGGRLNNGL